MRKGCKAAIVAPKDLEFGVGRITQSFGQNEQLPYPIMAFRSMDEAKQWLDKEE
jgi:hypothetical protein